MAERARRSRARGYGPHPCGSGVIPAGTEKRARSIVEIHNLSVTRWTEVSFGRA